MKLSQIRNSSLSSSNSFNKETPNAETVVYVKGAAGEKSFPFYCLIQRTINYPRFFHFFPVIYLILQIAVTTMWIPSHSSFSNFEYYLNFIFFFTPLRGGRTYYAAIAVFSILPLILSSVCIIIRSIYNNSFIQHKWLSTFVAIFLRVISPIFVIPLANIIGMLFFHLSQKVQIFDAIFLILSLLSYILILTLIFSICNCDCNTAFFPDTDFLCFNSLFLKLFFISSSLISIIGWLITILDSSPVLVSCILHCTFCIFLVIFSFFIPFFSSRF